MKVSKLKCVLVKTTIINLDDMYYDGMTCFYVLFARKLAATMDGLPHTENGLSIIKERFLLYLLRLLIRWIGNNGFPKKQTYIYLKNEQQCFIKCLMI